MGQEPGFRWRGEEVTRLEGFSDAVFGFMITLLVISTEVPKNYNDLLNLFSLSNVGAFAICFLALMLLWRTHFIFFRRYGLQDGPVFLLNTAFLLLVTLYIYPLKFLFGWMLKGFPVAEPGAVLTEAVPIHVDQITQLIHDIKTNPTSRRLIVSAWNVGDLDKMNLPPCHLLFQFYVNEGRLSCQLYQRSADIFLGVPFNIASYALLTMIVAQVTGLKAGDFVHTFGDAHIYNNHFDQVDLQLSRTPFPLPQMKINPDVKSIFGFKYDDFELVNYQCHPHIKGEVSI